MWVASYGGAGLRSVDRIMHLEPIDSQMTQAAGMELCRPRRLSPWRLVVMLVVVLSPATLVAAFFGNLAGAAYSPFFLVGRPAGQPPVQMPYKGSLVALGRTTGALLGLCTGIAWCLDMIRRALRGRLSRPSAAGAWLGLLAGWSSTAVLHAVLSLARGKGDIGLVIIGLICATVAGPALGAIVSGLVPWACGKPPTATGSER
jgi:hypothetical protein